MRNSEWSKANAWHKLVHGKDDSVLLPRTNHPRDRSCAGLHFSRRPQPATNRSNGFGRSFDWSVYLCVCIYIYMCVYYFYLYVYIYIYWSQFYPIPLCSVHFGLKKLIVSSWTPLFGLWLSCHWYVAPPVGLLWRWGLFRTWSWMKECQHPLQHNFLTSLHCSMKLPKDWSSLHCSSLGRRVNGWKLQTLWYRGLSRGAPLVTTTCQMQGASTSKTSGYGKRNQNVTERLPQVEVWPLWWFLWVLAGVRFYSFHLRALTVNVADFLVPVDEEIHTSRALDTARAQRVTACNKKMLKYQLCFTLHARSALDHSAWKSPYPQKHLEIRPPQPEQIRNLEDRKKQEETGRNRKKQEETGQLQEPVPDASLWFPGPVAVALQATNRWSFDCPMPPWHHLITGSLQTDCANNQPIELLKCPWHTLLSCQLEGAMAMCDALSHKLWALRVTLPPQLQDAGGSATLTVLRVLMRCPPWQVEDFAQPTAGCSKRWVSDPPQRSADAQHIRCSAQCSSDQCLDGQCSRGQCLLDSHHLRSSHLHLAVWQDIQHSTEGIDWCMEQGALTALQNSYHADKYVRCNILHLIGYMRMC